MAAGQPWGLDIVKNRPGRCEPLHRPPEKSVLPCTAIGGHFDRDGARRRPLGGRTTWNRTIVTLATGPAPVPSNRLPPLSTSIAISFDFPAAGSGCDGVEDRHKSPAATMGGGLSTR